MTGNQFVACDDTERRIKLKYHYGITCDWKAEMNLRTPKTLRITGASSPRGSRNSAGKELYFLDPRGILEAAGRFGLVGACGLWDDMSG